MDTLRLRALQLSQSFLDKRVKEISTENLGRKTIVFSPHPDDETLGCGGTILKKNKIGAKTTICFMTNGERSHPDLISEEKLKLIRVAEAKKAGCMLGVKETDMVFLDLPDSKLSERISAGTKAVQKIILSEQPDEVFIPFKNEPVINDHVATNRIVLNALKSVKKKPVINEYPIWLWYHFPWVNVPSVKVRAIGEYIRRSLIAELNLTNFRSSVYVGDVINQKMAVLNSYESQLSHMNSKLNWNSLKDIGQGDFFNCFLREFEIFYRYEL